MHRTCGALDARRGFVDDGKLPRLGRVTHRWSALFAAFAGKTSDRDGISAGHRRVFAL
jgi:hypothetical protein